MLAHHLSKSKLYVKETVMNWNQIESNWKIFKVKAKLQWEELTEAQLDMIVGQRDGVAGDAAENLQNFETCGGMAVVRLATAAA